MVASGPQIYPGASTAYWFEGKYPGDRMEVNVLVLHTTEGPTLYGYDGGSVAPNLTAVPDFANKKLKWYQHFYIDTSSRALVNAPGGVQTNTLNVCQVELVGTCDPATHEKWTKSGTQHIFWPEAPDWAMEELAKFVAWLNKNHDVPVTGPKTWLPYPKSYGATSSRMSFSQWNSFKGICGHSHVPENFHGDPGDIDFAGLVKLVNTILDDKPVPVPPAKQYYAFPGAAFFKEGKKSPVIEAMHKRLVAVGCNKYKTNTNIDTWGSGDVASYAAWQKKYSDQNKLGWSGDDVNGTPGKTSWDALRVPKS